MTTTTINLLDKFRFENPQYNNIDDEILLKDIHTKYYSDMNFDEYKGKVLNTEAKFNNLANIQRFNMNAETEYDYCKNSNAIACITPERLKEIKNMKPMGIIEANRGIVSFFEDDDKARMNKISEKYNNGETLTEEEQKFIADFVDYQAQMQIRGITWKGKTVNGFIQNIPTWIQTTLVKAAFEYGVVKMGTAGAAIGASIGGPIGAGVGAVAGAITGKISKTIAEPMVQTLLMPHQIQANETERTFQGTFQLTPKGEVFINKLNQAEKELISKQAITSTFIENVNEAIWDALFPYIGSKLAKTKAAQAIAKSKLGKITQKVISNKLVKLINDKAPALKFSGLAGEEWEEIATDIMNNYITEDKTIAESFKDSLDRDWFVELGIIAATGLTTNITMRGLRELSKRGATSQEKAIFNSLKEEDKIRMLNELDEVEKQQFNNIKEQYKQDLKTITNYTDEQIDKGMEFHDKMFLYGFNYFNNDNLSINEWNKEYGFKILENIKGELKGGNNSIDDLKMFYQLNPKIERSINNVINSYKSGKSDKQDIGNITDWQLKTFQENGLNVNKDTKHIIDTDFLKHKEKKHGIKTETDKTQIPVIESDIKKIPYIINDPDAIILGKKSNDNKDSITYIKQISRNTSYYVETVKNENGNLEAKTMWIKKGKVDFKQLSENYLQAQNNNVSEKSTIPLKIITKKDLNVKQNQDNNILNQAINRNIDLEQEVNVLDIKNLLKNNKNITKAEAKKLIWNIAENGEQIKTLSEPWVVDILNNRVKKNHLLNSSLYSNFTNRQYNRHNIELNNLRDIINNSVLIERVDNIKQDKKPNVEEYFYFYTPITDGNKTYLIKSVAEKLKGEKDLKNVHLYDIIENQLNLSGKADTSLHKLPSTNSADVITIKQILSNVKDINGKNALESYIKENGLNQLSTLNNSQLSTPNNSHLSTPLGQYDITNRIMYLSKQSNITTFQHEMMHWWRQTVKTFADVGNKQAQIDMDTLNKYVGATTDSDWTREQEEVFARAWEQYLRRGIASNKQLQSTFDKIREWFIEIYKTAKDIMYNGKPIELNKNIIEYFDKLMNLDTIQQQDIETNYNIQYDKLKNEIDEARNILYQEEPDFTEEEINAILRERFKEQLTPLEELQYRIEQENKKTLKQKVNEIFNTYQYDKQEFKDLANRVKTEIKDISKTIKNLKNGDVKIAEIDNQDLSIEDIIELRNIANKRLPRRPMTLMDFVKRKGGIWEGDKYGVGELQRIKGLVHKNPYMKVRDSQSGKINFIKRATVDDLRRASEEAGFLNRHSEVDDYDSQITLNDFLNALSDEESGTYYYRPEDRNKVLEYETLKEQQNQAGVILQKLEQDLNLDIDNILDIYKKAKENNFKIIDKDRIKLIQEESKKAQNDIKNIIKEIQSKEQIVKQELNAELKEKINTIKEDLKNKALEEQQELKAEYKDKLNTIKQANKILTTDLKQGFKNKIKTIKAIQSKVIEMINQANLDNENKAKFLSTIKNIQTEEDFIKNKDILIERIQRYEQRQINKIIKNTINNELKHTKDIKKGNKRVGRYQYQDNLLFKDLRQYNKNTIFQNELALNDLMTTTPPDEKNSTLYNIKERFLNYKINGLNNSIEFSQQVLKDIKDFKEIALENKNEVDEIRYNKKRLMFNELKQSIQQNKFGITGDKKISTKLYNWGYLTNGANQYSMMNFIFNKDIAEKYNMEIAENDYKIASFKRISEMNEKIELINDKNIDSLMLDWQNDTIDINVFDPERATNPDGLTYTETWNKLQLFDVYNAIKDKKTRQDYFDYYGQDKIESLVETLTSKERQTADVIYDAVQDYERLNEFVIKHYNKDLKRVENYWPKTSEHQQSIDILELNNGTSLQFNSENGTYGSFIKDRVQGSVKPITTNAYTKATGHINEVEYLLNVAEIYKQNKEIITNNDLSSMIKQKFGDNIFKNYSDIIANQSFSTKQKYISLSERLGQTLLNNYAAAKLGANPTSFARQLGAFTNYGIDAKNGFYKEVVNTLANFPQAWNYMKNLDWVQERLHSSSNIELSRILESKENIINLGKHLNVISKTLNKLDIFKVLANLSSYGDLLSVVVGGYSQIQANIKNGMAEAEAQLQCRKSTFRTQQSNLKASQSNLQNNTGFIKRLFTMFTSATNQMKRNVADAMVQYSKGEISKGKITEIITNYIFLQAANYVILGYLTNGAISAIGGMLGFDNDDEREKDKHTFGDFTLDIAQQILETITIDFPIARQLTSVGFETVKKKITGKGYYVNGFSFPIMSDLLKDFNKLASKKEYTLEDFLKGFGVDMTELLTGAPIKTAIRLNKKITGKDLLRN